jgi:hypothetical protein
VGPILLAVLQQGHGGWGAVAPILALITSFATLGALLLHVKYRHDAHGARERR